MTIQLFRQTNLYSYTEGTHSPPCYTSAKKVTHVESSPRLLVPRWEIPHIKLSYRIIHLACCTLWWRTPTLLVARQYSKLHGGVGPQHQAPKSSSRNYKSCGTYQTLVI